MHLSICKQCGGTFFETSKGARGEDLCDRCEDLKTPKRYRYANSILWGDTYDAASGMHVIEACSPQQAYDKANRSDKADFGFSFLQVETGPNEWEWCEGWSN